MLAFFVSIIIVLTVGQNVLVTLFCFLTKVLVFLADDNSDVEYPISPISRPDLHELRSEAAKLRLNGMIQQVDILIFCVFNSFCLVPAYRCT